MQRSSETIGTIAAALAKAQALLVNPEKSLTGTIRADGRGSARTLAPSPTAGRARFPEPSLVWRLIPIILKSLVGLLWRGKSGRNVLAAAGPPVRPALAARGSIRPGSGPR